MPRSINSASRASNARKFLGALRTAFAAPLAVLVSCATIRPLASPSSRRPRTTAFHAVNTGSNPVGDAIFFARLSRTDVSALARRKISFVRFPRGNSSGCRFPVRKRQCVATISESQCRSTLFCVEAVAFGPRGAGFWVRRWRGRCA